MDFMADLLDVLDLNIDLHQAGDAGLWQYHLILKQLTAHEGISVYHSTTILLSTSSLPPFFKEPRQNLWQR